MNPIRRASLLVSCVLLAACSQQVAGDKTVRGYAGTVPLNLSGSWERDYSRGDDVNVEVGRAIQQIQRASAYPGTTNDGRPRGYNSDYSRRKVSAVLALAQLADAITRVDTLNISQSEHDIIVERKGDFAIFCEFYDGAAQGPVTEYGNEICGWDGSQFVSRLILPDGLRVTHRFTLAPDGKNLHVSTTVSSGATSAAFTLDRYYVKFERPSSEFNCIETLSMKRVCSTGEIKQ